MSTENPDIRGKMEESRDNFKKLELLIPGLRGYRQREDVRVADELLRNQMADRLDCARASLESLRRKVVGAGDYSSLGQVGSAISQLQALSGEVRHAQQGYSGFVAPIKIDQSKLEELYSYDYSFVSAVVNLEAAAGKLDSTYDPASSSALLGGLSELAKMISDARAKWSIRLEAVEGILVQGS